MRLIIAFNKNIRHFKRFIAIKLGVYPKFILNRFLKILMQKCFKDYSKIIIDNIYYKDPILSFLTKKGKENE